MIASAAPLLKKLLVLAICLLPGRGMRAAPETAGPESAREAAIEALEEGRWDASLAWIEKAIRSLPADGRGVPSLADLLRLQAEAHFRRSDPEEAVASLRRLWSSTGRLPEIGETILLAESLLAMGDSAATLRVLEPMEKSLEDSPHGRLLLGEALAQEGRTDDARRVLLALSRRDPPAEALHRLGVIYFEEGAHEEALRWFQKAIALRERDYYSRIYCARSCLELGRIAEASGHLEEARGIASTGEVHYLLGTAAARRGELEKAVASFQKAIEVSADYTEAVFSLAEACRKLGRNEAAEEALARFRDLHRRDQSLLEAAGRLEQSCHAHPADVGQRTRLARLYGDHARWEDCERWAWKAVLLAPGSTEGRLLLASALERQGLAAAAALHYRKVLRLDPDHPQALQALQALIRRSGRRVD
ncbi:MAG: tetratricopeptide repeat protein [Planctomycetes bacterium]|nr:tetratricopeptide repeat protein [Planctomycetota bacterium]